MDCTKCVDCVNLDVLHMSWIVAMTSRVTFRATSRTVEAVQG